MTQLGKYDIIAEIGRGGFGVVYQARDLSLERLVALKVLHPQLTVDPRFIENFYREARNLARIHHPNVVTVYEIGEEVGRLFIAMAYLPGGSLADRLKREGPLAIDESLKIIKAVGAGLEAGHKRNVIHRDIKPGNILFGEEGQTVIADFGVARAVQLSSLGTSTQSSGTVGTPFYRPPELWRGTPPPSPATDVYSLACVLYEMLTGEVLFSGDTPDQVLARHVLENVDDLLAETAQRISAPIQAVLIQALAKDPQERCQGSASFIEALTQALTQALKPPELAVEQGPTRDEPPDAKPRETINPAQPVVDIPHQETKPLVDPLPGKQGKPAWLTRVLMAAAVVLPLLFLGGGMPFIGRAINSGGSTAIFEPTQAAVVLVDTPTATSTNTLEPKPTDTQTPLPTQTKTLSNLAFQQEKSDTRNTNTPIAIEEPDSVITFEDWLIDTHILVYEDMWGSNEQIHVTLALERLGLDQNATHVNNAIGDLMTNMRSTTTWDLIVIAFESRSYTYSGEVFEVLSTQLEDGASVVLEIWYLDRIASGTIQPLMQNCGIALHQNWERRQSEDLNRFVVYIWEPDSPVLSDPNEITFLGPSSVKWPTGDVGDLIRLIPGSKANLLAGLLPYPTHFGLIAECFDGRMLWQTFSSHDYRNSQMLDLWENYIYNALKARYDYLEQ
jgi:serine/threonine protein kinase